MVNVTYAVLHGIHISLLLLSLLVVYRILCKTQKRLHRGHLFLFFFIIALLVQHIIFFLNYKKVPTLFDFIIEILNVIAFLLFVLGFSHIERCISDLYFRPSHKGKR